MIKSFSCKDTQALFAGQSPSTFSCISKCRRTKTDSIAHGNQFSVFTKALKGDRAGQYSIRINQQWRVCFRWLDGDVVDVEIVDYH